MFNLTFVILISLLYIAIVFGIALLGDRYPITNKWHSWVYGLSLTIFCTSWTFYGATLQFAENGWFFSPTHIGTMLLFAFGMAFWRKLIRVAKQENVTTISDFIASRYGHSRIISILAAMICLIGIIPYVALQFKAISTSFSLVTGTGYQSDFWLHDSALIVSIAMGVFAILFGTRHLDTSEHHPGMMLAIAFESIVKLVAFIVVAYWAITQVGGGFGQVFTDWIHAPEVKVMREGFNNSYIYTTQIMLGVFGIFVLPRQFHVAVVEYRNDDDLKRARWLFPTYLVAINLFIAPLAIVGLMHFSTNVIDLEYLILKLPLSFERTDMAALAFIGGLSAATSMVIVATVALSTMLSNEILLPMLIRFGWWNSESDSLGRRVLQLRRIGILLIVVAAFFYYRLIVAFEGLVSIGLISFTAVAQFIPALVLGLFWTGVNRNGAIWGLSSGFLIWFYTLLLPLFSHAGILPEGFSDWLFNLNILNPYSLFGVSGLNPVVHGLAWSLALNTLALLLGSAYGKESLKDRIQASRFVHSSLNKTNRLSHRLITIGDLHLLIGKFVSKDKQQYLFEPFVNPLNGRLLSDNVASAELIHSAERMLTSVLGAPASSLLFEKLEQKQGQSWRDVTSIVDEASQVLKFNRDLLNSALQSINQGISIVDRDLNIVAWNQTYQKMFTYPEEILSVGRPVQNLLNHNAFRGECGEGEPQDLVLKRLDHLTKGTPFKYERKRLDGSYLEIEGRAMTEGGYITVYTDVTERRLIEDQLRRSNEYLEETVNRRTKALQASNAELEKANKNKTRFLAAAGHDLVQPLNSAALFAASLQSKLKKIPSSDELVGLSDQIEQSLQSAENLLNELLEISKLDSDIIKPSKTTISFLELQRSLVDEFSLIAKSRNVSLTFVPCSLFIKSDVRLLRRILQNLLSNAINYSHGGRVVMGVRRRGTDCRIDIIDTGPGLTEYQAKAIFDEFYRVAEIVTDEKGLGLGLAIVRRMAALLDHKIELETEPGKGSRFSVRVPVTTATSIEKVIVPSEEHIYRNAKILCLDNEQSIIDGMKSLIEEWGYDVIVALSESQADLEIVDAKPDLIIIDYHLNNNETGLNVISRWQSTWLENTPVIVITADYTDEVREATKLRGFQLLKKPVRPMQLKSLIASVLK